MIKPSTWRHILGFINAVAGGALAGIGLVFLTGWGYLAYLALNAPPSPQVLFLVPVLFMVLSFLVPSGPILISGIRLLRGDPQGLRSAVIACAVTAGWGVLAIVASVAFVALIPGNEKEAGEVPYVIAGVDWVYAAFTGLLLLLARERRTAPVADAAPEAQEAGL